MKGNVGRFVTSNNFGIGKVHAVREVALEVEYFDSVAHQLIHAIGLDESREATLSAQTRCYWLTGGHWRVGRIHEELPGAYSVLFQNQIMVVPEAELFVRWAKPLEDPIEVLLARACESPRFHASRQPYVESLLHQRASSRGLAGVLSSRAELHQHQVEIARRVLEDPVPRYLLADEVGLGKTIESGFILRQLFLDHPTARALLLVPPFLVQQWREELATKFSLGDFRGGTVRVASHLDDETWVTDGPFDILVVDEAHNIAERWCSSEPDERKRYERVVELARRASRLLLLSATPLVHNEETFLAMLHILDPASYQLEAVGHFRAMVAARAEIGRVMLGLTEDAPTFLLGDYTETLRRLFLHDRRLVGLLNELDEALAREDAASGEPKREGDTDGPDDDSSVARRIRAIRVHLSETHRIYRRFLRTRRTPSLEESFPVRGRSRPQEVVVQDADRRFADIWLERWRDAAQLSLVLIPDAEERRAHEQALAGTFQVFLERALSSIPALSVAGRLRRRVSMQGDRRRDLTPTEIARLTAAPLFEREKDLLDDLIQHDAASMEDVRVEAIVKSVVSLPEREKTLVFTSFRSTAEAVHTRLSALLGPGVVAHHLAGGDVTCTEGEIAAFRDNPRCRVLVCDRSGEEGRNFQFVQRLVHYDLPWSPNRLEQRLGRVDRFGVGGTVRSVVFVEDATYASLHDEWLSCLGSAFVIFERSIAAYQFAVDRLMPAIEAEVFAAGSGSIAKLAPWIAERLKEEGRAIAEQDVLDSIEAVERNDPFFEEFVEMDEDNEGLRDAFEGWATRGSADLKFRYHISQKNRNVFTLGAKYGTLVPRDWLLRFFRDQREQLGTFSRVTANRNTDVRLFRVGMPLYDGIAQFSEWDDRGRTFALWRYRPSFAGRDPAGALRFDYIAEADVAPASSTLEGNRPGMELALQRQLDGLLPPIMRTIWMDVSGGLITDPQRLAELEAPYDQGRGDVNLRSDRFASVDAIFGQTRWESLCREARRDSEKALRGDQAFEAYLREHLAVAHRTLHGRLEILRARAGKPGAALAATAEADREEGLVRGLLAGIAEPRVRLESVGFVVLAGNRIDG